jgi:hypothetical protein
MKSIFVNSLSFAIVLGTGAQGLLHADCLQSGSSGAYASFTMVTLKNYASNNPYASFVAGTFDTSSGSSLFGGSETYSTSGGTQLFSDLYACTGGLFCVQPFDINQSKSVGVSVTKSWFFSLNGPVVSYSGTLTGSVYGKITFPLTCDATTGILYGNIDSSTHVAITTGAPFVIK